MVRLAGDIGIVRPDAEALDDNDSDDDNDEEAAREENDEHQVF